MARALQLDADEHAHLHALAHGAPAPHPVEAKAEVAKPGAVRLLHSMGDVPAVLFGRFNDILAWNRAGHLLLAGHLDYESPSLPEHRPNQIKLLFLDRHTRDLHADWESEAALAVSSLRYIAAQFADDRRLAALVGELSVKSLEFARLWAGHDVWLCTSGTKWFRHPEVGEMTLGYEVLHLHEGNGQRILAHTAESGSASEAALRLLTAN